ncbi:nervous system development [Seminavis robusta]|uniref:Nervous system development n=1 Tax=Seminavis robusta TaxID=568900 RepID=A0A9N8DMB8_9STRA|nr:nervous system development [Seminavis robusta]|eukprot:Sro212_g088210.1 nervous system development (488) ;mRNA; f:58612-60075
MSSSNNNPASDDVGSKVLSVESTVPEGAVNQLAALTAGNKRPATGAGGGKTKFARVSDYELLPEDEQGQLKWRADPKVTFSDWTIQVVSEGEAPAIDTKVSAISASPAPAPDVAASTTATPAPVTKGSMISPSPHPTKKAEAKSSDDLKTPAAKAVVEIKTRTDTYNVHRYFLGFGSRRSEYFGRIFQEAKSGTKSKLELEPLAAKAFPDVLDFLYDPRSPLQIETETAVALHHLGIKLEMTHLQHYAKEFCQSDLSLSNIETYYAQAKLFDDSAVMDLVVQFVGKNVTEISATSNFVRRQTNAALWKQALEHVLVASSNFATDLHLSKLISEFGAANKDTLTAAMFVDLTDESKIRKVDPDAALALCQLDDDLHARSAAGSDSSKELSSLQQRCATALAKTWKELDASDAMVQGRSASFLVHLLGKCLQEAKTENEKLVGPGTRSTTPRGGGGRPRKTAADRVDSSTTTTASGRSTSRSRAARGSH